MWLDPEIYRRHSSIRVPKMIGCHAFYTRNSLAAIVPRDVAARGGPSEIRGGYSTKRHVTERRRRPPERPPEHSLIWLNLPPINIKCGSTCCQESLQSCRTCCFVTRGFFLHILTQNSRSARERCSKGRMACSKTRVAGCMTEKASCNRGWACCKTKMAC